MKGQTAQPKRIQRKRAKGFRMPENTVYVGRPTKFGNPYWVEGADVWYTYQPTGQKYIHGRYTTKDRAIVGAVILYEYWLNRQLVNNPNFLDDLRGKDLACFCSTNLNQLCHADILLKYANQNGR